MTVALTLAATDDMEAVAQFVSLRLQGQLVGLPIQQVRDVFMVRQITPMPGADPAVLGLVNVRGRIIPVLSLEILLGLPPNAQPHKMMVVGVELGGEIYGVQIDHVGDVLTLPLASGEDVPGTLDSLWRRHARKIYKLETDLMIELDLTSLLATPLIHMAHSPGDL